MPFVLISRNPAVIGDKALNDLVERLQKSVAEHLSCEELPLTLKEVSVLTRNVGEFDRNMGNLQVIIFAHDFPTWLRNVDERTEKIAHAVRMSPYLDVKVFGIESSSVYISLAPAGFAYL